MKDSVIAELDCTDRVRKRAQWEAFGFTLLGDGLVEVANNSYPENEVADHTYVVKTEDGTPVDCECAAAEHFDGACKHQMAVAIRSPLLAAATESERREVAPDGGNRILREEPDEDTCKNGEPHCDGPDGDDLPCFACFSLETEAC